jgi:hypothetical protein
MEMGPNSIATAVLSDLIKKSFDSVMGGATNALKQAWQKLFEDFKPFMGRNI